ncbi:folate-sensitive fragile site protein Fra10Ac1-domain-containing protein [Chytridium lagenaria]|nr:folate-sensitive fragile site protein Fra10Ac1-domain-containing protein [Chytridium lagenaria]
MMSKPRFGAHSATINDTARTTSKAFRKDFQSLSAHQKHATFINDYFLFYGKDRAREAIHNAKTAHGKSEAQILKEHHRFLRDEDEDDEEETWEKRLAKKYKEGKIALRWRTQKEVVEGKGQFTCGNLACDSNPKAKLKSWEVNFAYREAGETKNALVKLRLCDPCAYKLNYRKIQKMEKEKAEAAVVAVLESAAAWTKERLKDVDEEKRRGDGEGERARRKRREKERVNEEGKEEREVEETESRGKKRQKVTFDEREAEGKTANLKEQRSR